MRRGIVVLVLLLAACEDPSGPTGGLEVSTEVSPTVVRVGQTVTITSTVTNTSGHDITYYHTTYCGFHMFVVENLDGDVVGPPPPGVVACAGPVLETPILRPGEHYVGTEQSSLGVNTPGTYRVRGFVNVLDYVWSNDDPDPRRLFGDKTFDRIKSAPVTIQITP
jgi:hypothetical protein